MKPMTLIFIGAIIAICGGLLTAYGTYKQNKKSSEKSDRIETGVNNTKEEILKLKEQNDELRHQSIKSYELLVVQEKTVDSLRKENTDLSMKLSEASRKIYNSITGGESYCYITVLPQGPRVKPTFELIHVGNVPLKNVRIGIEDLGRRLYLINANKGFDHIDIGTLQKINATTFYNLEYPVLYPNTEVQNIEIPIEDGQQDINLTIWIYLENGPLFETLVMKDIQEPAFGHTKMKLKKGEMVLLNKE